MLIFVGQNLYLCYFKCFLQLCPKASSKMSLKLNLIGENILTAPISCCSHWCKLKWRPIQQTFFWSGQSVHTIINGFLRKQLQWRWWWWWDRFQRSQLITFSFWSPATNLLISQRWKPIRNAIYISGLNQNSGFDFGNGYFDNDYGQTLFLDGILMDIMIDNGEI